MNSCPTEAPATTTIASPVNYSKLRVAWEIGGNIVLAFFFLLFLITHGKAFLATYRFSTLLVVIKVGTDVFFYLIRRLPKEVSVSPYDWIVGLMGTYMVACFRPEFAGADNLIGQFLQTLGLGMQVGGMMSLNTSIGITAANRGIKTGGLYRLVRHPLYLSYAIAFGGFVLNQMTWHNIMIYFAALLLWVLRILAEERLLTRDADYREYAARVRWRLVPFAF
jgi:protein-S-isoprenylcysteine O-methyltransferase Ste14